MRGSLVPKTHRPGSANSAARLADPPRASLASAPRVRAFRRHRRRPAAWGMGGADAHDAGASDRAGAIWARGGARGILSASVRQPGPGPANGEPSFARPVQRRAVPRGLSLTRRRPPGRGGPPRSPGENRPVPTLAKSDVERAAAVMLAWMRRHGPGTVVDYHDLANGMRDEVSRGRQPRSHLHLLRAGAER